MTGEPFIRDVDPPLTEHMLQPLDPRCRVVQFNRGLSDGDYRKMADFLLAYPDVTMRFYGGYDRKPTNLDFLRFFPHLRAFEADALHRELVSLDGLRHLPADLKYLGLGATHKRLSLAPLARFTALRRLYLEGHTTDLDVLTHLTALTSLTLRSITLPDLRLLLPLTRLRALDLKLGGTRDLTLLPKIGALQYVELWQVRGLHDLNPIGQIPTLEHVFLQALKPVTTLPALTGNTGLTFVHLETMKGITDLSPLLTAPALTDLVIFDMPQLQPADIAVLSRHPTLHRLSVALGERKNTEVNRLLPLPPAPAHQRHPALTDLN